MLSFIALGVNSGNSGRRLQLSLECEKQSKAAYYIEKQILLKMEKLLTSLAYSALAKKNTLKMSSLGILL